MLIAIPILTSDTSLVSGFSNAVKKFGPYPNHQVLFVSRPSEVEQAKILMDEISGLFGKSDLHVLGQECTTDIPQGPNYFWEDVSHHLQFERGDKLPWLWIGLDSIPLKKGWLDAIETEYNLAKMPFLGYFKSDEDGDYLSGTAVYPPNISDFSILYSYASKIPTPFDVLCRWEFTPRAHKSQLIQSYSVNSGGDNDNAVLLSGCSSRPADTGVVAVEESTPVDKPTDVQVNADTIIPRRKRTRSVV